ncbi:RNA-directed DNA polymerase [Maricaulis sp.]|uniref:RNA-directed DNA polymerase n=1 Tax=Maricaulis sp. TaxID=1486257 RepID=UPI003A937D40
MSFKDDLLRKGSLPEEVPPAFHSGEIADAFENADSNTYFTTRSEITRPARFSASKRGLSRRVFSFPHPTALHDAARFCDLQENQIFGHYRNAVGDLSAPIRTPDGPRAVSIASPNRMERERYELLSGFRFVAKTDISRFYPSIYTHSIPWAFHGKQVSKRERRPTSSQVFFNRIDQVIQNGQDGQTVGIPIGPDTSRVIAEVVSTAIDVEFLASTEDLNLATIRAVDDVWIGAETLSGVELGLSRYREAIRTFELDINDAKTQVFNGDFSFSDQWPSEMEFKLEQALNRPDWQAAQWLRSFCEWVFREAVTRSDDGIIKYAIRLIDRTHAAESHWATINPFLKRCISHYGHSIDFVVRVLIWRQERFGDLDDAWQPLLIRLLQTHGELGNDSEISWILYACIRFEYQVPELICEAIVRNGGALSVVALLNGVEAGSVPRRLFDLAFDRVAQHDIPSKGPDWPIVLEWKTRTWNRHAQIEIRGEALEIVSNAGATIFDARRLTQVFRDHNPEDEDPVREAIESRTSFYDEVNGAGMAEDDEAAPF